MLRGWLVHQIERVGTFLATLALIGFVEPSAVRGEVWATSRSEWANSSAWQLVAGPLNNGPNGVSSNWMRHMGTDAHTDFGRSLEYSVLAEGGCLGQNPWLVWGRSIPARRVVDALSELRYNMAGGEVDRLIGTDLRSYVGLELRVPDGIDREVARVLRLDLDWELGEPRYETYRYYIGNIAVIALFYYDGESRALKSWLIHECGTPNS